MAFHVETGVCTLLHAGQLPPRKNIPLPRCCPALQGRLAGVARSDRRKGHPAAFIGSRPESPRFAWPLPDVAMPSPGAPAEDLRRCGRVGLLLGKREPFRFPKGDATGGHKSGSPA